MLATGVAYGGVGLRERVVHLSSTSGGIHVVPWGYMWTLREGGEGAGGLTAYGVP